MELIRRFAKPQPKIWALAAIVAITTYSISSETHADINSQLDSQKSQLRYQHINPRVDYYIQSTAMHKLDKEQAVKVQLDSQLTQLRPQHFNYRSDVYLQTKAHKGS